MEKARVRFVLFGGMAVSTWIEPRLTHDCDIVVAARRRDAPKLKQALIAAGARVTALEMRWLFERRFVRLKTSDHKLDVHLMSSAHDRAAFAQAWPVRYGDRIVMVARPEDLVLYKLQAWRGQDQLDIRAILDQVKDLDRKYIESWLDPISKGTGLPMRQRWEEMRRPTRPRSP